MKHSIFISIITTTLLLFHQLSLTIRDRLFLNHLLEPCCVYSSKFL